MSGISFAPPESIFDGAGFEEGSADKPDSSDGERTEDFLDPPAPQERERYEPQRSIFEILESSELQEDEIADETGLIAQIHAAVQLTIASISSPIGGKMVDRTPSKIEKHSPIQKNHRTAEELKDFAISLTPHALMVVSFPIS